MYNVRVGDVVQINGLVQHTYLNGRVGRVVATDLREDGGILVDLGEGEIVPVRAMNLTDATGRSLPGADSAGSGHSHDGTPQHMTHPLPAYPIGYHPNLIFQPHPESTPSQGGEPDLRPLAGVEAPIVYPGYPDEANPRAPAYPLHNNNAHVGRWEPPRPGISGEADDPAYLLAHPTQQAHGAQDAYERRRMARAAKMSGDPAVQGKLPPIPILKNGGAVQVSGAHALPRGASPPLHPPPVSPMRNKAVMFVQDPVAAAQRAQAPQSEGEGPGRRLGQRPIVQFAADEVSSSGASTAELAVTSREAELMRHIGHLAAENQRLQVELLKEASSAGRPLNHVSPAAWYDPLAGTRLGAMLKKGTGGDLQRAAISPQRDASASLAPHIFPSAGPSPPQQPVPRDVGKAVPAGVPVDYLRAQEAPPPGNPLSHPILSQPVAQKPHFLKVVDDAPPAAALRAPRYR
eukprot:TRINITY_DN23012_c0_g1_i1.p1 TRINITY_DN23012_c0_g1~~TRINITY_DN23012_c0_g1_i1.p1  ORF type:complete len:461 (+),score=49.81 TRINITY_DN23012_c0_g1_i1:39-1421(+)